MPSARPGQRELPLDVRGLARWGRPAWREVLPARPACRPARARARPRAGPRGGGPRPRCPDRGASRRARRRDDGQRFCHHFSQLIGSRPAISPGCSAGSSPAPRGRGRRRRAGRRGIPPGSAPAARPRRRGSGTAGSPCGPHTPSIWNRVFPRPEHFGTAVAWVIFVSKARPGSSRATSCSTSTARFVRVSTQVRTTPSTSSPEFRRWRTSAMSLKASFSPPTESGCGKAESRNQSAIE